MESDEQRHAQGAERIQGILRRIDVEVQELQRALHEEEQNQAQDRNLREAAAQLRQALEGRQQYVSPSLEGVIFIR